MSDLGNKEVFAKNLNRLMSNKGVTRADVCESLGVSYSTFADWCNGKKYPRIDKIEMLANYFHVKKSDLVERKIEPADMLYGAGHFKAQHSYYDSEVAELAEYLHKNPDMRILLDSTRKLKPEDVRFVIEMVNRINRES